MFCIITANKNHFLFGIFASSLFSDLREKRDTPILINPLTSAIQDPLLMRKTLYF